MKKLIILVVAFAMTFAFASHADAVTRVRSYYRSNGTYVPAHYRSDRDYSTTNNWSYHGNVNPYTGKKGYRYY